jgi:succinate dehydrogenase / fumarate reductase, cytochrome b subunit
MSLAKAFTSSIGKKLVMGFTGLFLISFLVIHVSVNSMIFLNDKGESFNAAARFMSHNWIVRFLEIGLLLGIIIHIAQGYLLTYQNNKARETKYAVAPGNSTSKWYSRSMGVLGSIILIFLAVHLSHFWIGTKANLYLNGDPKMDTFLEMKHAFSNIWTVIIYCAGVIGLGWHLVHGFPSAFQTIGLRNPKYEPIIKTSGVVFTLIVCLLFCLMPILMHINIIA